MGNIERSEVNIEPPFTGWLDTEPGRYAVLHGDEVIVLREWVEGLEAQLAGAVEALRELRDAGAGAIHAHAEHEEFERWRRAERRALDFLGGQ